MKKIWILVLASGLFAACNNNDATDDTTYGDTMITEPGVVNDGAMVSRAPMEGDIIYTEGEVRVYRNDGWQDADAEIRLEDGTVIYADGRASRNGTIVMLEDGYIVDRKGNVWDRAGNTISDAWDATKHGVKEAGKAIGEAAEKTGDKVKDAVN